MLLLPLGIIKTKSYVFFKMKRRPWDGYHNSGGTFHVCLNWTANNFDNRFWYVLSVTANRTSLRKIKLITVKINGWVGRESRTRSSWRRARGEPRLIDPWRGGLVNVTQSNGSASLKCQLYPDKPSRFILMIIDKSNIKQCWRDSLAVYLLTGDD